MILFQFGIACDHGWWYQIIPISSEILQYVRLSSATITQPKTAIQCEKSIFASFTDNILVGVHCFLPICSDIDQ